MRLAAALAFALLLTGCGYHLPQEGGGALTGVQTLHIELFSNMQFEPFLEIEVTDALTGQFARKRGVRLVDRPSQADAILSGTIITYTSWPVSYNREDDILEYRSTMTVSALLRRSSDNRTLWKGTVSWAEEYPAADEKGLQEDNEAAAIDTLTRRLAEELYFRLTDNF